MAWIPTNMTALPLNNDLSNEATTLHAEATLIDYLTNQLSEALGMIVELETQLAESNQANEELQELLDQRSIDQ